MSPTSHRGYRHPSAPGNSNVTVKKSGKSQRKSNAKLIPEESQKTPYLNHGMLRLELNLGLHRFFTYPADFYQKYGVGAENFAECGFYMAQDEKNLICHFCSLKISLKHIKKWPANDLFLMQQKHQRSSPECTLGVQNIPIGDSQQNIPIGDSQQNIPIGDFSHILNYKMESHRLFSLLRSGVQHNWKHVTPYDLSKNGFYYAGIEDNTRCSFCSLEIRGWEPGDTAEKEHRRWNPTCKILVLPESTGNVMIGSEIKPQHQGCDALPCVEKGFTKASNLWKIQYNVDLSNSVNYCTETSLGIKSSQKTDLPKFEQFSTRDSRLDSFQDWPISMSQKPQDLADAGFFYDGCGDRTICFQCGLGLKDWDCADKPWDQHVKWAPSCPYLHLVKGSQYLDNCSQDTKEENFEIGQGEENSDSVACRRCHSEICAVSLPCGHMTECLGCFQNKASDQEEKCLHCGKNVLGCVKVFLN